MKRIVTAIMICVLCAGVATAQAYDKTVQDERTQEEKNLETLSKKLVQMKREMNKFINDMSATYSDAGTDQMTVAFGGDVKVDVAENDKDFTVAADLPGMDKDKIDITLERGRILRIAGMRHVEKIQSIPGVVRQERLEGKFERVVELPAECKSEGISASYKDGVLKIVIPKKETAIKEAVKVKVQ